MGPEDIRSIAVLGTGMMGPGIALLFAGAEYATTVWGRTDDSVGRGRRNFRRNTGDLVRAGVLTLEEASSIDARLKETTSLEAAVKAADLVVEAVAEDLDLKQSLFAELERLCPSHTILASSTSTLLPTDLSAKMQHRERMLVAHFWNPAYLVPLVEVCGSGHTSDEVSRTTVELLRTVGKEPILMKKEVPGFIGNRIQHAMNREAISLVENGVVDPKDIDKAILASFGPRFAHLGLLEYLDFCGLDLIESIQRYLYADLDCTSGEMRLVEEKVAAGELGVKSGRGFFDWSDRDLDDVRARRDREFVRRLKQRQEGKIR